MQAKQRIAVAMSGGVDSSVVAARLAGEGHEVIGLTLQLYDHGAAVRRPGACCAGADIADARAVAAKLGIAHYVLDRESRFRQAVMDDFANGYMAGRTPIPCVRCNQTVKFTDLLETARALGCDALATGHYAQIVAGPDGPQLHRGADPARDQSYFLFATTREQLAYLRFPVGALPKAEVRAEAERLGLPVAAKPDSQDICFVPQGRYADVVRRLRPDSDAPGDIVDLSGRVLGRHAGLIHFTVGQRRGLGVGGEVEPLYVVRLEPEARRVVVGPREALGVSAVRLEELNWLVEMPGEGLTVTAKVRSAARPACARADRNGRVVFAQAEYGVAPGQACVLYAGERVVGGGFIASTDGALSRAEIAAEA
ncbi:MAG: tRNA 2-thiouridine(34) synthase MnmA [Sphingomonadaceae bacterium]|nr:tRNA 2-thiouridine(34) synthase MnmA [Sphingomonadaceae bacterium]